MEWLKNIIVKMVGKKVSAQLEKWGISKTKVIAIVGVIIYALQTLGPAFGQDIKIPEGVFEILAALGLWAVRDGMDTAAKSNDA